MEPRLAGVAQGGLLESGDGLAGVAIEQVQHADAVPAPGGLGILRALGRVAQPPEAVSRRLRFARSQRGAGVGEQGGMAHRRRAGMVDRGAVPRRRLADFAVVHVYVPDAHTRFRGIGIDFEQARVQPLGGLHLPGVQGGASHRQDGVLDALDAGRTGIGGNDGAGAKRTDRTRRETRAGAGALRRAGMSSDRPS